MTAWIEPGGATKCEFRGAQMADMDAICNRLGRDLQGPIDATLDNAIQKNFPA